MKVLLLILLISSSATLSALQCKSKNNTNQCFKGRLEVKGICMNYTIKVLQGNMDKKLIESEWKDEQTGKTYQKVFGLSNPCTFPDSIKEGDEFYFTITTSSKEDCMMCMAYYPTPQKKLNIAVTKSPCK